MSIWPSETRERIGVVAADGDQGIAFVLQLKAADGLAQRAGAEFGVSGHGATSGMPEYKTSRVSAEGRRALHASGLEWASTAVRRIQAAMMAWVHPLC
mgnify:CR=1 FL=1